jgi:hypothetical protein
MFLCHPLLEKARLILQYFLLGVLAHIAYTHVSPSVFSDCHSVIKCQCPNCCSGFLIEDYSILRSSKYVEMGNIADVSELHAPCFFRLALSKLGECYVVFVFQQTHEVRVVLLFSSQVQ